MYLPTWREIKRAVELWRQRRTRGFDDAELYSLDVSIAKFALDRIKSLRVIKQDVPDAFFENYVDLKYGKLNKKNRRRALKNMNKAYDSIEYFLQKTVNGSFRVYNKKTKQWKEDPKVVEGRMNFGLYFNTLWS
jgi:hypothetical protein